MTNENYNDRLLALIRPDGLNVLTIHAEVEGILCAGMFESFVKTAQSKGIKFAPLRDVLAQTPNIPQGTIIPATIPGREGLVACQAQAR